METQKTQNGQNNLEKEEQSKRNHPPWPQTVLESYSNQHSVVLVKQQQQQQQQQKQTHSSIIHCSQDRSNLGVHQQMNA